MSEQSRAAKLVSPLDAYPVPDVNAFAAALCEIEAVISGKPGDLGTAYDLPSRVRNVVERLHGELEQAREDLARYGW